MPDNIEYITFNNDELQTTLVINNGVLQPQNSVRINGTIAVNYTQNRYDIVGNLTVSGSAIQTRLLGGGGLLTSTGANQYQVNYPSGALPSAQTLSLTYNTQNPTETFGLVFNSDPGQSDNMLYSIMSPQPLTSSTTPPATPCFATGTAIATARGPVHVEDLVIGDMVLTSAGTHSRIRWIGHRTVDCRRHSQPDLVLPVRIAAHAFGTNAPARDLVLSPGHSVCVDVGGEVLIPAEALVNGTSVVRQDVETVTYWHVELEAHDILLAENLPCESYLEMDNRGFFAESGVVDLAAGPDATPRTHADFCRPYHNAGAIVDAARRRLEARAAATHRAQTARTVA